MPDLRFCCHQLLSWWGKPHPTDIVAGIRRRLAKAAVCALVQRFAGDGSVVRNAGIAFMVGQAPPYGYCGRESAAGRRKRRFARWFTVSQATVVWCGMLALRMSGINARPTFAVTNRFHGGQAPPYGYCGRESAAGRRKRRFARWFTVSQATVVWCRRRHARGMLVANVRHKCPTYVCRHQPLSRWGKPHPTDIAGGNSPQVGESGGRVGLALP